MTLDFVRDDSSCSVEAENIRRKLFINPVITIQFALKPNDAHLPHLYQQEIGILIQLTAPDRLQ